MKPSILIVMLDFLVCSLLMFVVGDDVPGARPAAPNNAATAAAVDAAFSSDQMRAMEEQWNRTYDDQMLLAKLNTETVERERLAANLDATTATLETRNREAEELRRLAAEREQSIAKLDASLESVAAEKTRVEQEKARVEQEKTKVTETLSSVESKLATLSSEHGELKQEKTELQQRAQQLGQTVASQQATIQTLSEGVRESQEQMASQFTDFAHNQQQMASTLGQLDEFARTLPATIKSDVAEVHDTQRDLQNLISALVDSVRNMQSDLNASDDEALLAAVSGVAQSQENLQGQVESLMKMTETNQVGQTLGAIQVGQESLQGQAAMLGEQLAVLQAGKPGPFKAVQGSRLELLTSIAKRADHDAPVRRFKSSAYPPVVQVNGKSYIVAHSRSFGLQWSRLASADPHSEVLSVEYNVRRQGATPWSMPLDNTACALAADPQVVSVELEQPSAEIASMQLAGADAVLGNDRKLHVFKTSAAGLSFEVNTSPDLADPRYLIIQRPMRAVARWFENPAFRADVGDYLVTSDGKLVGLMIDREKCLILQPETVATCAMRIPLGDRGQFHRATVEYSRLH